MKYLFIILIAFSFLGCNKESDSNPTVYATFTIVTNGDNVCWMQVMCWNSVNGPNPVTLNPVPVGFTLTTDAYVEDDNNVICYINSLTSADEFGGNLGLNTQVEINVYVNNELHETRLVTGIGTYNFIVD